MVLDESTIYVRVSFFPDLAAAEGSERRVDVSGAAAWSQSRTEAFHYSCALLVFCVRLKSI